MKKRVKIIIKKKKPVQQSRLIINKENIIFRFTHKHSELIDKRLKDFLTLHCGNWMFHKENLDRRHKKVNDHYHCWIEKLKNKKKSFSDAFSKEFPELKRQGRGGAHKKSQIKYLNDPIQFYYNFKNIKFEEINQIISSIPITIDLRVHYLDEYNRLCKLKKSQSKFYQYYLNHKLSYETYASGEKKHIMGHFSDIYIDYCIEFDYQRIHPNDQIFKYNYCLSRVDKSSMLKILKNNLDNYICRNTTY